jgi:hypothetical protein
MTQDLVKIFRECAEMGNLSALTDEQLALLQMLVKHEVR